MSLTHRLQRLEEAVERTTPPHPALDRDRGQRFLDSLPLEIREAMLDAIERRRGRRWEIGDPPRQITLDDLVDLPDEMKRQIEKAVNASP